MMLRIGPTRRGMTFIEFTMALAITAMVAGAIAAMISAVSSGERTRRDNRSYLVRTHAVKARLKAYLSSARAILAVEGERMVVWYRDSRRSDTVHASEIRWIERDDASDVLAVYFVRFPAGWTEVQTALEDDEYDTSTDWWAVREAYQNDSYLSAMPLVDGLEAISMTPNDTDPLLSDSVLFEMKFVTHNPDVPVEQSVEISLMEHAEPKS